MLAKLLLIAEKGKGMEKSVLISIGEYVALKHLATPCVMEVVSMQARKQNVVKAESYMVTFMLAESGGMGERE